MSTERRPPSSDGLFILGLVGRAGSGKSTVARALEADGARRLDADRVGHEVTDRDPEVRAALAAEYGADVYRPDGTLDRRRVGAKVFSDAGARQRLDRLVHPRIVRVLRGQLDELRTAGFRGLVVVEAALMFEWGFERDCDAVLALTATTEEQVARMRAARGWTEEEARARLAVQRDNPQFESLADVTIDNHGTLDALERRAREAVARLRAAARRPDPESPDRC